MAQIFNEKNISFELRQSPIPEFSWHTSQKLSEIVKSKHLEFDVRSLDAGKYSYPYHFHRNSEEIFVILSGKATLRTPNEFVELIKGDIVFFEIGPEGAHQLYNHTESSCTFLDLGTHDGLDICEYPDSGKINILPYQEVYQSDQKVDYYKGEDKVSENWPNIMSVSNLNTERLILIPMSLDITNSLIEESTTVIEKLGLKADSNWPTEDTKDILPMVKRALEKSIIPTGFGCWMIVKKATMKIIGDIGFKGQPDEKKELEIGYGLVEKESGKGFATEALREILDWALSQKNVNIIKADCLINNLPSIHVLEKVGMKETNRDHELIYWELQKNSI
ncbi:GNAT family N-acetyltransferase [Clostridium bowmanii]|uniref:GNAT family N-acetyltransferase n=1 Tax=Clostridium bowmanii TaxID=132925 RepID=UPI001C0AA12F|nr:GNAT family N-acetyltransferase [Clostridium bowmanii]MBU3191843.1 GNAT family N-acetyltransferase [Clostridium bowmanii]MCA1076167.1 GNAT family N-acetyltransferase [Clostridium bowmanii]